MENEVVGCSTLKRNGNFNEKESGDYYNSAINDYKGDLPEDDRSDCDNTFDKCLW